MTPDLPLTQDLVLIGGGHTHALVLRQWGMNPLPGARLTVINPGPTAPYSGMLPGFVAGHYTRDELDIDLVSLARLAGARLINGAVTAIDTGAHQITVPGRGAIAYDVASLDVGITSAMPDLPGFAAHGVPAKPLGTFATRWHTYLTTATTARIAIIGGGVAGAELALAMTHALQAKGITPTVHLIDRSGILSALGRTARKKMQAVLDQFGVTCLPDASVTAVLPDGVELADGRVIPTDFTTGAAGALPHPWLAQIGVETTDGYITVDRNLASSDPSLFAVGDCAHMAETPRPKAGVFAVRQAPVLFDNLRATLSDGRLRAYAPQKDYLKLISLGGKSALAEKFGTARAGPLLWRLKDHIDQKFMRQFQGLTPMGTSPLPAIHARGLAEALGDKPMCGGCGSKVGRAALMDTIGGDGDDAAVLTTHGGTQIISTDHLRAFWADPTVMGRIAAIHALGDIWAMGAAPQAATINLILPRLSAPLQQRTLTEINAAITNILTRAGAQIAGGHTSLGAELTIGLTVTGLCDRSPITLRGAQPGDALILTKPLGSGVIMAAEMAGKAEGADVLTVLALMQTDQATASKILFNAHAMTDVTGFGLAGHLAGLCAASGVGATLNLDTIPLMPGAKALAQAGIRSSLFADNVAGAGIVNGPSGPAYDLLFDPQTAGGLLAAVPDGPNTLADLIAAGYPAAHIGEITQATGITVL